MSNVSMGWTELEDEVHRMVEIAENHMKKSLMVVHLNMEQSLTK